jgi:hypothetical protein
MSTAPSQHVAETQRRDEERSAGYPLQERYREHPGPRWGLFLTGVAILGLGFLAWNALGPDIRRYLKIRNM